jgi:hypothetical protein
LITIGYIHFDPCHDEVDNKGDFIIVKRSVLRDLVPFFETAPAAGCGSVLCDENGMVIHLDLTAVVFGRFGSDMGCYKVGSMLPDGFKSFFGYITDIVLTKSDSKREQYSEP